MQRLLLAQRFLRLQGAKRGGMGMAAAATAAAARLLSLAPENESTRSAGLCTPFVHLTCTEPHATLKCRLKLSPLALDALSGAVGEIAQVSALYPMDTIKASLPCRHMPAVPRSRSQNA